jgi:hypothetical protein
MTHRVEELERQIEESRGRLGDTLEAIQDRLSPSGIVDGMLGSVRIGQGSMLGLALAAARRNPLPVLLIAAGTGWLLHGMSKVKGRRHAYRGAAEAEDIPVLNTGNARVYDPDVSSRHPMHDSLESRREMSARV